MTQTTGAISQAGFKIEVSTDGTSWSDISGQAATVTVEGGDYGVGEQMTAEGAEAVVVPSGKRAPVTVTCNALYTETAQEAWALVRARYEGDDPTIWLRWSPKGGAVGESRLTCAVGGAAAAVPIVSCNLPEMDAGSEDPALFEFSVRAPGLLRATIST